MKALIIYKSYHHQNTYRLIKHLNDKEGFALMDVDELTENTNIDDYDVIGLASGIYGFEFHKDILKLVSGGKIKNKKVFLIFTSCMDKESFASTLKKEVMNNNNIFLGCFHTKGYCTFGPLKLFGGVNKNLPDDADCKNLDHFIEKYVN